MQIKLSEQAKTDVKGVYEYYKSKEKSLGKRFKTEFNNKIDELIEILKN